MNKACNINKGFIATTAVMMMACSIILYEVVVLKSAVDFADSATRYEWRIQASLNAESCASTVALMAAKDYFLQGDVSVPDFGCFAHVVYDRVDGIVQINTQVIFAGVSSVFSGNYSVTQ